MSCKPGDLNSPTILNLKYTGYQWSCTVTMLKLYIVYIIVWYILVWSANDYNGQLVKGWISKVSVKFLIFT